MKRGDAQAVSSIDWLDRTVFGERAPDPRGQSLVLRQVIEDIVSASLRLDVDVHHGPLFWFLVQGSNYEREHSIAGPGPVEQSAAAVLAEVSGAFRVSVFADRALTRCEAEVRALHQA